jgi:hypothetical protein
VSQALTASIYYACCANVVLLQRQYAMTGWQSKYLAASKQCAAAAAAIQTSVPGHCQIVPTMSGVRCTIIAAVKGHAP